MNRKVDALTSNELVFARVQTRPDLEAQSSYSLRSQPHIEWRWLVPGM
jgi:hypothetical protein